MKKFFKFSSLDNSKAKDDIIIPNKIKCEDKKSEKTLKEPSYTDLKSVPNDYTHEIKKTCNPLVIPKAFSEVSDKPEKPNPYAPKVHEAVFLSTDDEKSNEDLQNRYIRAKDNNSALFLTNSNLYRDLKSLIKDEKLSKEAYKLYDTYCMNICMGTYEFIIEKYPNQKITYKMMLLTCERMSQYYWLNFEMIYKTLHDAQTTKKDEDMTQVLRLFDDYSKAFGSLVKILQTAKIEEYKKIDKTFTQIRTSCTKILKYIKSVQNDPQKFQKQIPFLNNPIIKFMISSFLMITNLFQVYGSSISLCLDKRKKDVKNLHLDIPKIAKKYTDELVKNMKEIKHLMSQLSKGTFFSVVELIEKNGFALAGSFKGLMYDYYKWMKNADQPMFVSCDVILHGFHKLFENFMNYIEEICFFPSFLECFIQLLKDFTEKKIANKKHQTVINTIILPFIGVTIKCLDPKYDIGPFLPTESKKLCNEEYKLIESAKFRYKSPIFHKQQDYSQFKIRGRYENSETLKKYFKALVLLGRMEFLSSNQDHTIAAMLLTQQMMISKIDVMQKKIELDAEFLKSKYEGRPKPKDVEKKVVKTKKILTIMQIWNKLRHGYDFIVGHSDDYTPMDYMKHMKEVYGQNLEGLSYGDITKKAKYKEFIAKLKINAKGKITQRMVWETPLEIPCFRFLGQSYVFDSEIYQKMTDPKVKNRKRLGTLDLAASLGSNRAKEILETDLKEIKKFPQLKEEINKIEIEMKKKKESFWHSTIYNRWIHALIPLLEKPDEKGPKFTQNKSWQNKNLNSFLSSYAELKHDTIGIVKDGQLPGAMIPPSGYVFVDPVPKVFNRLYELTDEFLKMFKTGDLDKDYYDKYSFPEIGEISFPQQYQAKFETLQKLCKTLYEFAEIEMRNLSPDLVAMKELHDSIAGSIKSISMPPNGVPPNHIFTSFGMGSTFPNNDKEHPIIADIFSNTIKGECLEIGTGYPREIIAIVPYYGGTVITKGLVNSFYEFYWKCDDRLSDSKWRSMLASGSAPDPPKWLVPNPLVLECDTFGVVSFNKRKKSVEEEYKDLFVKNRRGDSIDENTPGDRVFIKCCINSCRKELLEFIIKKYKVDVHTAVQSSLYQGTACDNGQNVCAIFSEKMNLENLKWAVEEKKVNINHTDYLNRNALHYSKDGEITKYLLGKGCNLNLQDLNGETPLMHMLIHYGNEKSIKLLLEAGTDMKLTNIFGEGVLVYAFNAQPSNLGFLLKKYIDPKTWMKEKKRMEELHRKNETLPVSKRVRLPQSFDHGKAESDILNEIKVDLNLTKLHKACEKGDVNAVKEALQSQSYVNVRDRALRTPLIIATQKKHHSIIKILLEGGANPILIDGNRNTAIIYAIENGDLESVKIFCQLDKTKFDINGKYCGFGRIPLSVAVLAKKLEIVKFLVEKGANVNGKSATYGDFSKSPIELACKMGVLDIAKFLYSKGAVLDNNLFFEAAKSGNTEIFKFLTSLGSLGSVVDDEYGRSLSYYAAEKGHLSFLKFMLKKGIEVNKRGVGKYDLVSYPLNASFTSKNKKFEVFKFLFDNTKNWQDIGNDKKDGGSILCKTAREGTAKMIKYVISKGGDINDKRNFSNASVLHCVIGNYQIKDEEKLDMLKFLVEKTSADIHTSDEEGETIIFKVLNKPKILKYLVSKGVDVNHVTKPPKTSSGLSFTSAWHNTLLMKALWDYGREVNDETIKFLLESGAKVDTVTEKGSIIHIIADRGNERLLKKFLDKKLVISDKIDTEKLKKLINLKNTKDGNTALHIAGRLGKRGIGTIKTLIEYGADKTIKNKNGALALATIDESLLL